MSTETSIPNEPGAETGSVPESPSALDIFTQSNAQLSDDDLADTPADLAINLKHYLYGWPKENDP